MKTLNRSITVIMMFLFVTVSVYGQQTGQQQQQMQQQQQLQQMVQKMNQLQERTHALNQEMNRKMQQTQSEQLRYQYQNMYRFGEQLGLTIGNLKNAAERCNLMLQDPQMNQDRVMQRDMEQLRQRLNDMTGQAEEALQAMNRIRDRLSEKANTQQEQN
jgi:cell division protein FtsB